MKETLIFFNEKQQNFSGPRIISKFNDRRLSQMVLLLCAVNSIYRSLVFILNVPPRSAQNLPLIANLSIFDHTQYSRMSRCVLLNVRFSM